MVMKDHAWWDGLLIWCVGKDLMEDVGNRDAPVSKYLNYVVINPLSFMQKLLQDTNLTHMEDFCQF